MSTLHFGPHTLETSSESRVLFPEEGLTKGELLDYYRRIAATMLPYLRDRPLTLHRFPDGIGADGFIQQQAPDYFPDFVTRATVEKEEGEITHAVCNEAAALVYLANQGCITPHVWLSRLDRPHHPDRLVFDLDPPGDDFEAARYGARAVREVLDALHLPAFLMTTGSRGLHVVVPLDRQADFDTVRAFARAVAEAVADAHPEALTVAHRKEQRRGRLFVDYLRNAYAQTAVPPYAVRALPGAPVATPLDWDELGNGDLHARRYSIRNLFRRLGQKPDPWTGLDTHAASLAEAQKRLGSQQTRR